MNLYVDENCLTKFWDYNLADITPFFFILMFVIFSLFWGFVMWLLVWIFRQLTSL